MTKTDSLELQSWRNYLLTLKKSVKIGQDRKTLIYTLGNY